GSDTPAAPAAVNELRSCRGASRTTLALRWPPSCSREISENEITRGCIMLEQRASVATRFEALDALRGVCALLVVLFHIPIYHRLKDIGVFGNLQFCVDLFFALSGFVLCHAYGQRLNNGTEGF